MAKARHRRPTIAEALNKEFAAGLFDYWKDRSEKNARGLLHWLLTIEGKKWHYLHGVRDPSKISPDNWVIDQAYQDRPGNKDIQLAILYNAKRNLDVYEEWQEYFRKHQPPMLITWGKNDGIFTVEDQIASLMNEFLGRTARKKGDK